MLKVTAVTLKNSLILGMHTYYITRFITKNNLYYLNIEITSTQGAMMVLLVFA